MDMVHHLLAGFKSIFSEASVQGVDAARRSCGGAGYSAHSGFTEMHRNVTPIPTYEGDNVVMLLQASRFLIKKVKAAKKGKIIGFPF